MEPSRFIEIIDFVSSGNWNTSSVLTSFDGNDRSYSEGSSASVPNLWNRHEWWTSCWLKSHWTSEHRMKQNPIFFFGETSTSECVQLQREWIRVLLWKQTCKLLSPDNMLRSGRVFEPCMGVKLVILSLFHTHTKNKGKRRLTSVTHTSCILTFVLVRAWQWAGPPWCFYRCR